MFRWNEDHDTKFFSVSVPLLPNTPSKTRRQACESRGELPTWALITGRRLICGVLDTCAHRDAGPALPGLAHGRMGVMPTPMQPVFSRLLASCPASGLMLNEPVVIQSRSGISKKNLLFGELRS